MAQQRRETEPSKRCCCVPKKAKSETERRGGQNRKGRRIRRKQLLGDGSASSFSRSHRDWVQSCVSPAASYTAAVGQQRMSLGSLAAAVTVAAAASESAPLLLRSFSALSRNKSSFAELDLFPYQFNKPVLPFPAVCSEMNFARNDASVSKLRIHKPFLVVPLLQSSFYTEWYLTNWWMDYLIKFVFFKSHTYCIKQKIEGRI